jgi:hypothetical protein
MGVSFWREVNITGKRWWNEFPQAPFFYFYLLGITPAASANKLKIKEGGPGEFIPLVKPT